MFLEIVSPEKTLFSGEVLSVIVPGTEGSFQILNNHAPIVSTLKNGLIKLKGVFEGDYPSLNIESSSSATLEVQSGIIEMKQNKLIILVG